MEVAPNAGGPTTVAVATLVQHCFPSLTPFQRPSVIGVHRVIVELTTGPTGWLLSMERRLTLVARESTLHPENDIENGRRNATGPFADFTRDGKVLGVGVKRC